MADYYPLIARAVAALDPASSTGESRRALYERARSALIAQLRSVDPPLTESEITRERLALEEAVRKVESEAAQRARGETPRAEPPLRPRSGDAFRAATRPRSTGGEGSAPAEGRPPRPPLARPERPARPSSDETRPPRMTRPHRPDETAEPGEERPPLRRPQRPGGAPQPGVSGLRDVVADADNLGRAAAQAKRNARRTYSNVSSPSPEFDRLEPDMEDRGADPAATPPPPPPPPFNYSEQPTGLREPEPVAPLPAGKARRAKGPPVARGGFPVVPAIILGLVLVLVGLAIWQGPQLYEVARGLFKPADKIEQARKDATPAVRPKITDRVGQPASSQTVAPVAQRVVLYDEDPSQPQGKQYVGNVVWRTEEVKGANGQAELAVRADIEIAERKLKMSMSLRRNTDQSLPASHTAELTFALPPDFEGGGIANVPGILMKSNEQARGTPLAGLAVKVTDNFFLIGLSNVEVDRSRNLQLLKERSWFDIPLVYANQRRAIIAVEKGEPGERAFQDAFRAWGE